MNFLPLVNNFVSTAASTGVTSRDKVALVVFSRLIAYELIIPSSPVDSPNLYYAETHSSHVNEMISQLNEACVLDVKFLQELTRKVWMQRYNLVFRPMEDETKSLVSSLIMTDDNVYSNEFKTLLGESGNSKAIDLLFAQAYFALHPQA